MSARDTLAENLRALMKASERYRSSFAIERRTEELGCKVGKSTVDRASRGETPLNIDAVDAIASVFGFDAWQLLVPGLQPSRPPALNAVSKAEEDIYKLRDRLDEAASLLRKIQERG